MPDSSSPNFLAQLDAIHADVTALLTMSEDRLSRQPGRNKWSALQCIKHIVLTNRSYFRPIQLSVSDAIAHGHVAKAPFEFSPIERFVLWVTEPPSRIRIPVPSLAVVPPPTTDVASIKKAYEQQFVEFRHVIESALKADLRKAKIRSPFARRASSNVGVALGVLLAHERRHIAQARKAAAS